MNSLSTLGKLVPAKLRLPAAILIAIAAIATVYAALGMGAGFTMAAVCISASAGYAIHVNLLSQKTRQIFDASRIHLATVEALATAIDAQGPGWDRPRQAYSDLGGRDRQGDESSRE